MTVERKNVIFYLALNVRVAGRVRDVRDGGLPLTPSRKGSGRAARV